MPTSKRKRATHRRDAAKAAKLMKGDYDACAQLLFSSLHRILPHPFGYGETMGILHHEHISENQLVWNNAAEQIAEIILETKRILEGKDSP